MELRDPFGHPIHVLEAAGDFEGDAHGLDLVVQDLRVDVLDLASAETSFRALGFDVQDESTPTLLLLRPTDTVPIALQARAASTSAKSVLGRRLLWSVEELEPAFDALAGLGLASGSCPFASGALGRSLLVRTSCGVELRFVERSPARLAFERLRGQAGTWIGSSTKGWTERTHFEVIAGGSAVLSTSMDAHPGERMATLFHMDGPELVLTHYCIAGNQPRLVARSFGDDGNEIAFAFESASNLASRDQGHMDACVIQLESRDAFRSTWSWYQAGATSWMEEIRYQRESTSQSSEAR